MIDTVPPAFIFIVAGLLSPLIKGRWKSAFLLSVPVVGFINLISIPEGTHWVIRFLEWDLVLGRMDRLSLIFGYIFHIISFIAILYALAPDVLMTIAIGDEVYRVPTSVP